MARLTPGLFHIKKLVLVSPKGTRIEVECPDVSPEDGTRFMALMNEIMGKPPAKAPIEKGVKKAAE